MSAVQETKPEIKRVGIIGSGTMGAGIAAHLANCGISSLLLKATPLTARERDGGRDAFIAARKAALMRSKPSSLYSKTLVDHIDFGSLDEDAPALAECDWICESVLEEASAKRPVFEKVAEHRRPGSIVSTNTSGIPLAQMAQWMDDKEMRSHFLGTHFFNPPRYLKLLELIPCADTRQDVLDRMADFGENVMGKRIIHAKDTPNFVANRTMVFMLQCTLHEMVRAGLRIEEVDALTGALVGHAASATFRTADLVGLDTVAHAVANVYNYCPTEKQRDLFLPIDWFQRMIEKGYHGEKSGCGFYKKSAEKDPSGKSVILSIDPQTLEYQAQVKPSFQCMSQARQASSIEDKIRAMYAGSDKGSKFVWDVFSRTAVYAADNIPEIAGDVMSIDNALKWGLGWDLGIFETWDMLGFQNVCKRMESEGLELPPIAREMLDAKAESFYGRDEYGRQCYFDLGGAAYRTPKANPNILLLDDVRRSHGVIKQNQSASLLDLGDGILAVEVHSKMNTIGYAVGEILESGIDLVNLGRFEGMVLASQGNVFSAGADLGQVVQAILEKDWDKLGKFCTDFQRVNMAMRFCRGPVVAAPHHLSLGAGIEMSQHAARVVIAGETYGGLVEVGVGLIPAGGGTKEMLRRALSYVPAAVEEGNPFPYIRRAFETICMAKVSTSGPELIDLGCLSENDIICENADYQLKRAKDVCRSLVLGGYKPPRHARLTALGEPVRAVFDVALYNLHAGGFATDHDLTIAKHVARVMTGGNRPAGAKMSEHDVLELECEAFLSLCGTPQTLARMQHMLKTGKPLRN